MSGADRSGLAGGQGADHTGPFLSRRVTYVTTFCRNHWCCCVEKRLRAKGEVRGLCSEKSRGPGRGGRSEGGPEGRGGGTGRRSRGVNCTWGLEGRGLRGLFHSL